MRLAYRDEGPTHAAVVVFLGGLGTTTTMWEPQLPTFAERYRVLRVDLPGHGASLLPDEPVTVAGIGGGICTLIDELDLARVSFVGLSLGGMVGQWLGANAPERLEGLVLACTGAALGSPDVYAERAALVRAEGTAVVLDGARERWFTPAFRDAPPARAIIDELRDLCPDGYAACCEAVGAFDFRDELRRIATPSLAIFGAEDTVTTSGVRETLASGIPHVRTIAVERAAHLANVEQPYAFSAAVLSHLHERAAT